MAGARDLAGETKTSDQGRDAKENETCTGANKENGENIPCSLYWLLFNSSSSMKTLHTMTALIELGAGLALLCFPSTMVALLVGGTPLEAPAALTVARVGGAGLLALGVACWLARGDSQSRAARGLVAAMLLYDVAAVAVLAFAGIGFGMHGVALWPAVVLHVVMAVWCVTRLLRKPAPITEKAT